jgi:hypothetical protein
MKALDLGVVEGIAAILAPSVRPLRERRRRRKTPVCCWRNWNSRHRTMR